MVFVSELCKSGDDLVFVALLCRNDRLGKTRLRELDLRKFNDACTVADRIVGVGISELGSCTDITCSDTVCGDLLLTLKEEQTADPLILTLCSVINGGVSTESTCVNLEDTDLTYERVGDRLEAECCKRIIDGAGDHLCSAVGKCSFQSGLLACRRCIL